MKVTTALDTAGQLGYTCQLAGACWPRVAPAGRPGGRVAGELAGAPGLPQGGAFGRRRSLMKALGRLPVKEGTATRPA